MFLTLGSLIGTVIYFINNDSLLVYSLNLALTIYMIMLLVDYDNKLRLLKNIKEELQIKSLLFTVSISLISLFMGSIFEYLLLPNLIINPNSIPDFLIANFYKSVISLFAIVFYTCGVSFILGIRIFQ